MLPLPGASSSTWAMWRARLRALCEGVNLRVSSAFWLFGLINNVLYVIILSAALDLIGPDIPKGVVLLADVIPSFITKLCAPYFIHTIPYSVRVILFSLLSAWGMLLIALTPSYVDGGTISTKLAGVVLASLSSGGGELSFLGLTHFYGPSSLAAWGSGTGGAGLVGAGAYSLATTTFGMSVQKSLFVSAFLPIVMLVSFFAILPRSPSSRPARPSTMEEEGSIEHVDEDMGTSDHEEDSLLNRTMPKAINSSHPSSPTWLTSLTHNLRRARSLFIPYMLPLLLVYIAEYTINLGLFPVLLFPLESTPFTHFRSFYPFYTFLYQTGTLNRPTPNPDNRMLTPFLPQGVFISRSSLPLLRIHHLYPPSLLQILNFLLLLSIALYNYLPPSLAVYIVFLVVFWEGLLGGAVYVNTFAKISDEKQGEDREWSLGAVTVSDSAGICVAGWLSLGVESGVCKWQVRRGWDACRRL